MGYFLLKIAQNHSESTGCYIAYIDKRIVMKDKISVLIIEDEQDMALLLKAQLSERYHTSVVPTLRDAIPILKDQHPDVVLLDNNLPDGLGLYFLPTIFKYSKGTAVIMMSALRSSSIEREAIEQGAVAFLEKPFRIAEIKETIQRIQYGRTG
jgi:DNA-binding NtrC family response regulator